MNISITPFLRKQVKPTCLRRNECKILGACSRIPSKFRRGKSASYNEYIRISSRAKLSVSTVETYGVRNVVVDGEFSLKVVIDETG
jgi:hypothetical protein